MILHKFLVFLPLINESPTIPLQSTINKEFHTNVFVHFISVYPNTNFTNHKHVELFISRTKIEIIIVYTHHSFFIFHVLFFISHTLLIFLIHFITLYLQYYVVIFHK